jgi:hypothetical protein
VYCTWLASLAGRMMGWTEKNLIFNVLVTLHHIAITLVIRLFAYPFIFVPLLNRAFDCPTAVAPQL